MMMGLATHRVSPFGHPGLTGCVRLPPAFRSLPRPSSPLYTQASPVRFRSLDYMIIKSSKARANYYLRNAYITLESVTTAETVFIASRRAFVYHDLPFLHFSNSEFTAHRIARRAFNCSPSYR